MIMKISVKPAVLCRETGMYKLKMTLHLMASVDAKMMYVASHSDTVVC